MVADNSLTLVLHCAAVDSDVLANDVVITDDQLGGLVSVLQVRSSLADGGKLIDMIVTADGGGPFDHHMRFNRTPGSDFHFRANQSPGPDTDVIGDLRGGVNNGLWMYHPNGRRKE